MHYRQFIAANMATTSFTSVRNEADRYLWSSRHTVRVLTWTLQSAQNAAPSLLNVIRVRVIGVMALIAVAFNIGEIILMHAGRVHPPLQRFLLWSSLAVFLIGMLVETPRTSARELKGVPAAECTEKNVAGVYGFLGNGPILPNRFGLPEGPLATVGLLTFDGQGRWGTANQTLTVNGQVTTGVSVGGTYTVEPDCTFILVEDGTAGHSDAGVFVHDRQEGFFMGVGEGIFVTFTMKRVEKKEKKD
jgi:hypothetical protein